MFLLVINIITDDTNVIKEKVEDLQCFYYKKNIYIIKIGSNYKSIYEKPPLLHTVKQNINNIHLSVFACLLTHAKTCLCRFRERCYLFLERSS